MAFEDKVCEQLAKPLPSDIIKSRTQAGARLDYIEGWRAIEVANEVFGFGGWSCEVVSVQVLHSERGGEKGNYSHVVRVHARVRVGAVTRDGIGVGVGAARDAAIAIELAEKAAETDAQKRALKSFGNRFGLALYDKDREGVGATREAQRLIDAVAEIDDVDAWSRANARTIGSLGPADQEDVRAAVQRRRDALATTLPMRATEAPAAPQARGQAPALHANAGALLKSIEEAKGPSALAELSTKIMATALNGSTDAVLKVYGQKWAKVITACADATSLDTALAKLTAIDEAWRGLWDESIPGVVDATRKRVGFAERQPGDEG